MINILDPRRDNTQGFARPSQVDHYQLRMIAIRVKVLDEYLK